MRTPNYQDCLKRADSWRWLSRLSFAIGALLLAYVIYAGSSFVGAGAVCFAAVMLIVSYEVCYALWTIAAKLSVRGA